MTTTAPTAPSTTVPSLIAPSINTVGHDSAGNTRVDTRPAVRGGAPMAPSGVTMPHPPLTVAQRDSILHGMLANIPELARTTPPTGVMKAELEQRARQMARVSQRATTAGNSRDVIVRQGEGLDGVGAVGGGSGVHMTPNGAVVSIPFPLFSPGPSPEERKRNEAIDKENRAILSRLELRAKLQKDSLRADSLRRDSLARRRVIPDL